MIANLRKILIHSTALFVLWVAPAHAMPAVVGGIGALVGGIGAGGLSLGSVAIGLVSMGAQYLISKMLTPEPKQRGIKTRMETGGDNPPTFIVGEYATPGQLIYANTLDRGSNIPEACLVYVICLSALPITAVSNEVFINNERCTIDTGSSWPGGFMEVSEYVKGGDGGGYCLMKFHLGNQTSADNWMLDKFGNDPDRPWNNNMFLPGCAYAIVQCWYSNRGIWTGLPDFRFVVRGVPVYDPRKDSSVGGSGPQRWGNKSTWEFSENPKVIAYNAIRGFWWNDTHVWGGKAEAYRLPLDYWFAAMNACDENVTKKNGDVIKRYEIGAEISFDDKPIDFLIEVDKSCDGFTTEFGGTYKTWCGGPGLPVATITDDDFLITAEMESTPFQSRQNTFNACYTTYPEPKEQWEVKDGPRYRDTDAIDEDGEELPLDLALPFVHEANQVQRIARAAIKDSRREVTHAGQLPPVAWVYEPFDCIAYQSAMFGYAGDGKRFFLSSKEDLPNVNQQVLLREVNPNDNGWLTAYELDFDVDPLVVVKPGDLELDFTAYADEIEGPSGRDKPAIRVEWDWADANDLDVRYIDWRVRRTGTTKIVARNKIEDVEAGEAIVTGSGLRFGRAYEIQFRPVPFSNRAALWTDWQAVTMAAVDVPTGLTLTSFSDLGDDGKLDFFVRANWDDMPGDKHGYGVKVTIDGDTRHHFADDSRIRFAIKAPGSATVQVRMQASDGGTPSDYCSPVTINVTRKNTAPTTPTGMTITGRHRRAVVKPDDHPDKDFRRWCLYYGTANNFASATKTKHSRSNRFVLDDLDNGQTYYAWLTAEDTSGNESAKYPASNTGGMSFTTEKIKDEDTDDTAPNTPSTPTITSGAAESDEDGKQEPEITIAWTPSGSGRPAKSFSVQIYRASSFGGSYTKWRTLEVDGDDTDISITPNSKFYYKAKVKAKGFNGRSSAFSALTPSGVKPNKRSFNLDISGLGIIYEAYRKKHVIKVVGAPIDDPQFSYLEVFDRSSGELIWRGKQIHHTRHNPPGTTGYRVQVYDRFGNGSGFVLSPSGASGGNFGVADVDTAEISDGAITTTKLENGAVSRAKLASGAAGGIDHNNLGTGLTGSVNAGSGSATLLLLQWKCTSNTAGVTVTLGSKSQAFDFKDQQPFAMISWESGGGYFTSSKSGGGTVSGAELVAITLY